MSPLTISNSCCLALSFIISPLVSLTFSTNSLFSTPNFFTSPPTFTNSPLNSSTTLTSASIFTAFSNTSLTSAARSAFTFPAKPERCRRSCSATASSCFSATCVAARRWLSTRSVWTSRCWTATRSSERRWRGGDSIARREWEWESESRLGFDVSRVW
ncbi:hypothetical protein Hanom_Chr07g00618361 [Helianthus anomalus]